jgi:general secretion pathway protein J
MRFRTAPRGFTLIELLAALVVLSLLALMSYRGLGAVLDARRHVAAETENWRRIAAFCARFEQDLQLAAARPVRGASAILPAWIGRAGSTPGARLEFSRFASVEGIDAPRRVAYAVNEKQEVELWLWPGLDMPADGVPLRYPVLRGVAKMEFQYLNSDLVWVDAWPISSRDPAIPRALRMRLVPASGGEIVRVFALNS